MSIQFQNINIVNYHLENPNTYQHLPNKERKKNHKM